MHRAAPTTGSARNRLRHLLTSALAWRRSYYPHSGHDRLLSATLCIIIIITGGLSGVERSRSHESTPCLTVLGSSIGGCQTNVERCKVRLHRPEPCMTRSAGRTIPVSWQRGQTGPKGSTVIHGWISTGNMAKKLETIGADNISEWRLVSML